MSLLRSLFVENPMLIEVRRYRRRLFGGGRMTGTNVAVLTLCAVCYVGLLLVVGSGNGTIPGGAIVLLQTFLFTVGAPIALNNSIAGEREKRTWDLLLVAPVTKAQIMIGKFAGAVTNLLLVSILMVLPILICAVSYMHTDWSGLLLSELNSLTFALLACAISLFFSARCRRPFTALGMALGTLAIALLVYPVLMNSVTGIGKETREFVYILHPFVSETRLLSSDAGEEYAISATDTALLQSVVFAGLSIVLLVWTERTLTFTDNEKRFFGGNRARG